MARTTLSIIQTIPGSDIWYCEAGELRVYLGIIKIRDGYRFVRTVAASYEEASFELGKSGEVVMITLLGEVIAGLAKAEE